MKYALLLLIPLFYGCQEPLSLTEGEVNSVSYSFHDASVAPEYHRSYTIAISPAEIHVVVDSYSEILADEVYPLSKADFSTLIQTINTADLTSVEVSSGEGCDGGTSESLVITENNEAIYVANIDHCGGTKIPDSAGDLEGVFSHIMQMVPNLSDLLK